MDHMDLMAEMGRCAPEVHPRLLLRLMHTESRHNSYAIGVNRGPVRLLRQPRTLGEAVATARELRRLGINFDAGRTQINVKNWKWLGLEERSVFDTCRNLQAAQRVLLDCKARVPSRDAQTALREVLSCFNTGNFRGGFANGYVGRVANAPVAVPSPVRQTPNQDQL
jgi:type IV secretion system protein VirB1